MKLYGNYQLPFLLDVGAGLTFTSGKPLTALAAHPVDGSSGEIPEGPRGSGFETVDGFRTGTRPLYTTAVHADYRLPVARDQRFVLVADVFNLFNSQTPTDYDPDTQTTFPVADPDFGQAVRANLAQRQTPRPVRIGVRYEF